MKVFITQNIEPEAIELLKKSGIDVACSGVDRPLTREEFLNGIADAEAIIHVWHTEHSDAEAMDNAPKLKIIARRGVGYDNIDIVEAAKRGIYTTVTPVHTNTIADLTFGLVINAARRLPQADAFVRSGEWGGEKTGNYVARRFEGYDIHHKTMGIIGFGRIGKHIAKRAGGFEMQVLYYDKFRQPDAEAEMGVEYTELDDLLRRADVISVNCALTEETKGLIGREAIAKMKPGAVIVLSARGGIIDETALYEALRDRRIGGAGLDVFEPEPIQPDNPLLTLDNIVFSPHLGTSVRESRVLLATTAAEEVIRVLQGEEPLYPIRP